MVKLSLFTEENLYAITGTGGRCFESHRVVGPINGLVQIYLDCGLRTLRSAGGFY